MAVKFTARRSTPELVSPARPTPRETKTLSDLDNYVNLRFYVPVIQFFRSCQPVENGQQRPDHQGKAIKAALAEALVYYYPIAGRLRELPSDSELVVDCTAEGVVLVEAAADVWLEEFDQPLLPPYPCVEELMCDSGGDGVVVGRPLFFMQVTQFKCGGFSLGFSICHSLADGFGMSQIIKAIADLASGEAHPVVSPVWQREILLGRTPPCVREIFPAYVPLLDGSKGAQAGAGAGDDVMLSTPPHDMVTQYLHVTRAEIASLQRHIPAHLKRSITTFELMTTVIWRCRTIALGYKPGQQVRLVFTMSLRGRWNNKRIPRGYYGNAFVYPIVVTTVDDLCGKNHLDRPLELLRVAKLGMSRLERVESSVDLMVLLRRRHGGASSLGMERTYPVSDLCRAGIEGTHFGSAEWVGGMPMARGESYHVRCKDAEGEESVMVCCLPLPKTTVDRFTKEMAFWLNKQSSL